MNRRELAHAWAHQDKARGTASALSYDGPSLYSYSTEIGRILAPSLVLMNVTKYSSSTAQHQSAMRGAIPYGWTIARVSMQERGRNMRKEDVEKTADAIVKALKAMKYASEEDAKEDVENLGALGYAAKVMGSRKAYSRPQWIEAFVQALPWAERAERWAKDKKERAAKAKEQNARERARIALQVEEWRKGERSYVSTGRGQANYLRVNGENVETSGGAKVRTDAARILWKAWAAGKDVKGMKVGPYSVNEQTPQRLVIGCHIIERKEADTLATGQGWAK